MAGAIKKAARSQRSHRDNKNFGRFEWNAYRRQEERAKRKFGEMLAEELRKGREKDAKED